MATSLDNQTPNYVEFDEFIEFQLQRARTGIRSVDVLMALAGVATLFLAYLLVFVLLDHWVIPGGFGQGARVAMLGVLVVATGAWLAWKVVLPYLRQVNRLFAARALEQSDPRFRGNLLNLVDLRRAGRPVPPEIMQAIEKRTALTLSSTNVDQAIDRRPLFRLCLALCAVLLAFSLYALFSPKKISSSVWRAMFPAADVAAPTQTEILKVEPGDVEVLARSQVEVRVTLGGEVPDHVSLLFTTADRRYRDEPLEMREAADEPGRPSSVPNGRVYRAVLAGENGRGILQNLTYRVVAGDARSREFAVTVHQPPSAHVDEVQFRYPSYMELPPKTQSGGHINEWEGTQVAIRATANMPVTKAVIIFQKDAETTAPMYEIPMQIADGTKLTGRWTLRIGDDGLVPQYYRIDVMNAKGERDPQPTLYTLTIRPDQRPRVDVIDPRDQRLERPANAILPMVASAHDPDFKLTSVVLKVEKDGQELPVNRPLMTGQPRPEWAGQFEWRLEDLKLKTGDRIVWWVEARDNRTPHANVGRSPRREIEITDPVPPQEAADQLQRDRQEQQRRLDEAGNDVNQGDRPNVPREQQADPPQDNAQDKPQDQPQQDQSQEQSNNDAQQEGQGEQQQGGGTSQSQKSSGGGKQGQRGNRSLDDSGKQDGEALRRLADEIRKEQQQQEQQTGDPQNAQPSDQSSGKSGNKKQGQPKGEGQQPDQPDGESGNEKGEQPKGENRKPGQPDGNDSGESQDRTPDDGTKGQGRSGRQDKMPSEGPPKNNTPPQPGESGSDPQRSEGDPPPSESPPAGDASEQSPMSPKGSPDKSNKAGEPGDSSEQPQPGAKGERRPLPGQGGNDSQKPDDMTDGNGDKPKGDSTGTAEQPEAPEKEGGADEGQGDSGMQPEKGGPMDSSTSKAKPKGGRPGDSQPTGQSKTPEQPLTDGVEQPDDGKGKGETQKRDATGNEEGVADPNDDPNADPMKQGKNVQRREGTDPKIRRRPADEPLPKGGNARRGSPNPGAADPGQEMKKQPDEERTPGDVPPSDEAPDPNGRKIDDPNAGKKRAGQKTAGEQPLPQDQPPSDRRSPQTDGGEAGRGADNQEGQTGSNKRGAGDNQNDAGQAAESDEPTGGQPSDKQGKGSQTRPTDGKRPKGSGQSQPSDQPADDPSGAESQPDGQGQTGDGQPDASPRSNESQQSDPSGKNQRPGGGRMPQGPGNSPADGQQQSAPASPEEAEQLNLEHGRNAADLVLRQLDEQLRRGEIDKDWLEKTGWNEEQIRHFADRLRRQLGHDAADDSPEGRARERQFEEVLKSVGRQRSHTATRSGEGLSKQALDQQVGTRRTTVPPEYRELTNAYKKAQATRTAKP